MKPPIDNPDFNRVSVLTATIMLAYGLARFVNLPSRTLNFQLGGIFLETQINVNTVVTLLVAVLTASGADWLLSGHPSLGNRRTIHHWVLPGLTAWILGITLNTLLFGFLWMIVFVIGAAILLLVLIAEYIVVDPSDTRYPAAVAGLTALSFALFLILAITLRVTSTRLILMLPALTVSIGLIALRSIYLRLHQLGIFNPTNAATATLATVTVALIMVQLTAVFHYYPFSPIVFGLSLLGPAYALTSLLSSLTDGRSFRQALLEPSITLIAIWILAGWVLWIS